MLYIVYFIQFKLNENFKNIYLNYTKTLKLNLCKEQYNIYSYYLKFYKIFKIHWIAKYPKKTTNKNVLQCLLTL